MSDPLERHPEFSVVRRLAVGGMGEVLLTRFTGNGHVSAGLVVVKRTIVDHPNRAHQDEMLREEGRVALRLRHANLVDTYALDELEGHPLLVMEYLAGRSMAQVLGAAKRKGQPVPVPVALAVLHGAACGLHFAHTLRIGDTPLGLVHRDVSPANIFATFDGKVKVIDFGVAKADDSEIKTSTGILKGKLGYMSPEHAKGETLDPRSDLWSLGVVFWEMLVADRLFGGQNPAMTLYQITQGQVDGPSKRRPDIPPAVEQLCMRLLTKEREERISSGAELAREIERLPAELWKNADVGGCLADRFPAEAETGQREVAEVARLLQAQPIPRGIVDDSSASAASADPGELATLVVDGPSLLAQAAAFGGVSPEALGRAAAPTSVDEQVRPFPAPQPSVHSMVTRQVAAGPRASAPALSSAATPLEALLEPAATGHPASGRGPGLSARPDIADPRRPSGALPMPPGSSGGQRASGPVSAPIPQAPGYEHPPVPRGRTPSSPAQPAAESRPPAQPPTPAPLSEARPPSATPAQPASAAQRPLVEARAAGSRGHQTGSRLRAPSAVAVALSTFGALALVMGLLFAVAADKADTAPLFVGYATAQGTDAIVARVDDVPVDVPPPFQVDVNAAHLALPIHAEPPADGAPAIAGRERIEPAALARELKKQGVWQRALLPKTSKQRVAAVLPAAITLLGLLSLAFALPGLLLSAGNRQLAARAAAVFAVIAAGGVLLQAGGLGWPGLRALEEPAQVPRLLLGQAPVDLSSAGLAPDQRQAVEKALVSGRAALLRGQPQAAIDVLAPAVALKDDLPELYGLLGEAHQDLEKHNLAEGHFLRYLQLKPDAPDRAVIDAYLQTIEQGG